MLERFVGHDRPEIRSTDTDIDHVADALAGLALPIAAAHAIGEVRHPVQNCMNVGDHVAAVAKNGCAARRAQRHMQDGAVLRDIDLLAAEHRVDAIAQPRLLRELQQQSQCLVGDPVLGIVEIDSGRFERQPLAAFVIVGKKLPQMDALEFLICFSSNAQAGRLRKGGTLTD